MSEFDPQGFDGLRNVIELFRSAIGLAKETADALPDDERKEVIGTALVKAEDAAKIAEAEIAQALGYELCRCKFPPTPMLQVGYLMRPKPGDFRPVFECPLCKQDTAAPYRYQRTNPEPEPEPEA